MSKGNNMRPPIGKSTSARLEDRRVRRSENSDLHTLRANGVLQLQLGQPLKSQPLPQLQPLLLPIRLIDLLERFRDWDQIWRKEVIILLLFLLLLLLLRIHLLLLLLLLLHVEREIASRSLASLAHFFV